MKTEISAGGIIVRKQNNSWEVLLISDMNNQLTFPKGLIEQGEDALTAAKREIAEEVRLTKLRMIKALTPIQYTYERGGMIQKTVQYFVFETEANEELVPQTEEGISKAEWIDLEKAIAMIGYPKTNKKLLEEVMMLLI